MVIYSRQRFERGSTPKAMSTPLSQADRMEDQVRVASPSGCALIIILYGPITCN